MKRQRSPVTRANACSQHLLQAMCKLPPDAHFFPADHMLRRDVLLGELCLLFCGCLGPVTAAYYMLPIQLCFEGAFHLVSANAINQSLVFKGACNQGGFLIQQQWQLAFWQQALCQACRSRPCDWLGPDHSLIPQGT